MPTKLDDVPDDVQAHIASMLEGGDRNSLAQTDRRRNAIVEGLRAKTREAIAALESERSDLQDKLNKIKVDLDKAIIDVMKKSGMKDEQIKTEMASKDSVVRKNAKRRVDDYLVKYKKEVKNGIASLDELITFYKARL